MNTNLETIKFYWQQVRKSKPLFFTALFSIPLGALSVDILLPYFASQAIGSIAGDSDSAMRFIILAGVVALAGALLNLIGFQALVRHESRTTYNLITDTFTRLSVKDTAFFNNRKTGAMTSNFINFVHAYIGLQDLVIIRTLGFIISIGTGLVLLTLHVWPVALIIFVFILLLSIQIRWSLRYRQKWRTERRQIRSNMHGDIADNITNNLIVRTFAREKSEIDNVSNQADAYRYMYMKDIGFASFEGSTRVLIMSIVQVFTITLCVYFIGQGSMDVGIAIFVVAYMQRIGSQIFILGEMINGYDQALLDAQPMTEMLMADNRVVDSKDAKPLDKVSGKVVLDNATYRYEDGVVDVIQNVNLTVPSGQKLGLVGHSGAGKSTIVQLLLRFNDLTGGSIKIDDYDLRDVTQGSLRENIAYVPQEPLLFHRSLRENIAYGKPDATDAEIISAARQANAWDFIYQLPDGLDTTVGERGVKLSGGQRQRIAIARAILKDAPILVLDEATSALDSESEKLIQASLETLMAGRTSIVIAHRLSTIAKLDRIVVLESGHIIEDGTHSELLDLNGTYAKLWNHQSGGFIEE